MNDNWYVALGLETDPPVEDEAEIAERIDEKARFWSAHFDDPWMGGQYRAWYQSIPQIKRDMIGPANIRRELASGDDPVFCDPLDKLLKTMGRKGHITAQEAEKVSGRLGIPVDEVKKRVQKLGIAFNADTTEEKNGAQGGPEYDADARGWGSGSEDTDKADDLCEQAQRAMEALKFEDAAAYLADAEKCWPGSRRISDLRARLEEDKSRAGAEIGRLRSAMGDKRYFEAQRRYADIRKLFPGYSDPAAQGEISQAISDAQALCSRARNEENAGEARALCEQAWELCRDLPDIGELMEKYPPAGSADPADDGSPGEDETIVTIRDIRAVNGRIRIDIDPPQGAAGFEVLYRSDRFPAESSDPQAIHRHITFRQYQYDGAIVLDILEERRYFFTVFAEFRLDGKSYYSDGAERLFDNSPRVNITYSISVTRRLFGERFVTLEFETAAEKFALPAIDVMCAVGNAPMFKGSARLFCSIPAQEVDGVLQIRIPLKDTPRDTYIKPFFRDETAYAGNQLSLRRNSRYKIT